MITFDAILIPQVITGLSLVWSAWWLWPSHAWALVGWPFVVSMGVLLPAVPTLAAWLLWAILA